MSEFGRAWLIGGAALLALAACDSSSQPEVGQASPLTNGTVSATATGSAAVQLQQSTISYKVDNSGSLVIQLSVVSTASSQQSIAARASLYDASGTVIGDAVGGQVAVPPGGTASLELTGPRPNGTINSSVFEFTVVKGPTPIANTAVPTVTYSP